MTPEQIAMRMTILQLKEAINLQEQYMAQQEIADNFYYINGRRAMDYEILKIYKKELRIKENEEKKNTNK